MENPKRKENKNSLVLLKKERMVLYIIMTILFWLVLFVGHWGGLEMIVNCKL